MTASHLPTLIELSRLYFDAAEWHKALDVLHALLMNEAGLTRPSDRVDLFFRLGSIREKRGEHSRAISMLRRALEIDPKHLPSLESLEDLGG